MNDAEILSSVKQKAFEVVESLIHGGGEVLGFGPSLKGRMSMSDASEAYWGMSGRGSSGAKNRIRIVASLGFVVIEKKGRSEFVGISQMGLDLYNELKDVPANRESIELQERMKSEM